MRYAARALSDLSSDDEVLIGVLRSVRRSGRNEYEAEFRFARLDIAGNRVTAIEESGRSTEFVLESGMPVDGSDNRFLWTEPLPQGDRAAVRKFCQVALDTYQLGLFYVTETFEQDVVGARFVTDIDDTEAYAADGDHWLHEKVGGFLVESLTSRIKGDFAPGDLVAGRGLLCEVVDGVEVHTLLEPEVVGNFSSLEAVSDFLPVAHDGANQFVLNTRFGSVDQLQRERCLAHASLEPDRALILATAASNSGSTTAHIIGHTGRLFMVWDDAADSLYDQAPGPGLWVMENAKGWSYRSYDGEYDAGIDADWVPASLTDLDQWGFSTASLDAEIFEYLENEAIESATGLAQRYIDLAEKACAKETLPTP